MIVGIAFPPEDARPPADVPCDARVRSMRVGG